MSQFKLTKIRQLRVAKKYFDILPYEFSILNDNKKIQNSITKPLEDSKVGEEILYTTRLNQGNAYRPFPWFFQKGLLNGKDITCVYIDNEVFFYECEFKRSNKNIDWRTEINKKKQSKWKKFEHKKLTFYKKGVLSLMNNFELNYGRLDFILADNTLYFLECNPNGQFGWLDDFSTLKLHKKFLNAFIKN